jgi:hypothetical protein
MGAEMPRAASIPIAMWDKGALIDHEFKFVRDGKAEYLFNLREDPREQQNLSKSQPKQHAKMSKQLDRFLNSIKDSQAGKDYPEWFEYSASRCAVARPSTIRRLFGSIYRVP